MRVLAIDPEDADMVMTRLRPPSPTVPSAVSANPRWGKVVLDAKALPWATSLAFSPDGLFLASAIVLSAALIDNDHIYVWHVATGEVWHKRRISNARNLVSLAISADNERVIYSMVYNPRICIYNIATGNCMEYNGCSTLAALFLRFNADGTPKTSQPEESEIPLTAMNDAIDACGETKVMGFESQSLTRDKSTFVWPSGKKGIVVWDLQTSTRKALLDYPLVFPANAIISPDGAFVVCSHHDGSVRVWTADGACRHTLNLGDRAYCLPATISADSKHIAIADDKGHITIFQPKTDDFDPDVAFDGIKSAAKTS